MPKKLVAIKQVWFDEELEQAIGSADAPLWSATEDETLRAYYGLVLTKKLAERMKRTILGVGSRARRLGLSFDPANVAERKQKYHGQDS